MVLRDTGWTVTVCALLDWRDLEYRPVMGCCEYGNEPLFIRRLAKQLLSYGEEMCAVGLDNKFGCCVLLILSKKKKNHNFVKPNIKVKWLRYRFGVAQRVGRRVWKISAQSGYFFIISNGSGSIQLSNDSIIQNGLHIEHWCTYGVEIYDEKKN